jgi:hypothetical protein
MIFNTADGKSLEGDMLVTKSCTHPGLTDAQTLWMSDKRFSQIAGGMPPAAKYRFIGDMCYGDYTTNHHGQGYF